MRVGPGIEAQMRRRGGVVLRIGGGGSPEVLFDAAAVANTRMVEQWELDEPLSAQTGLLVSNPAVYFAAVPPHLIMSVVEIEDVDQTHRRLMDALAQTLPEQTVVEPVDIIDPPPGRRHQPRGLLELRMAIEAISFNLLWDVSPSTGELIDHTATNWLSDLDPHANFAVNLLSAMPLPICPDQIYDTLQAQRRLGSRCQITATAGHRVRGVNTSYRSAHVSLLDGTDDPDLFHWPDSLRALTDAFTHLEPATRSALIRHTAHPDESGEAAHSYRHLYLLPNRGHLNIEHERALEETHPVDAQGILYLPTPPHPQPAGWTCQPFGHLYQLTAPNLDAWLAQPPTSHTITTGRTTLANLLD